MEPDKEDTLQGGKERILFVDDEAMLVELGKEMLEILGYHAVTCASPLDALNLFRQDPDGFDLIITDLTMPQMTGEMLAREINMVRSDIPILLVSGAEDIIDDKWAAKSGIKDRMLKPLHMGELSKKIRKLLES